MENLINKIVAIRPKIYDSVKNHYGPKPKLKMKWVIATRNVIWGEADLDKAKAANILVIQDQEIDYYIKLTDFRL